MADDAPKKHVIDVEDSTPVATDIDPTVVQFIILKAREFDVKVPPADPDPGSNPTDDADLEILEDYPDDTTEQELRDAIEGLSDDAAIDLVAMFWLGRGDFTAAEWQEARELAAERVKADVAPYLMGEPNLGDFLEDGLDQLGLLSTTDEE